MKILIIDPYLTASHAVWVDLLQQLPEEVAILTLPPYHWKWRMHGGSILLSDQLTQSHFQPDIIVASAMLDLNLFVAQSRPYLSPGCKLIVYFHENQLTYPISDRDQDRNKNFDNHYAFINFSSALLADKVLFNSKFHQSTFLDSLPAFLSQFPDESLNQKVRLIEQKSSVISPGYDDQGLLRQKQPRKANTPPIILWNHRWEYDKDPDTFFYLLQRLRQEGLSFQLVVLGKRFRKTPKIFEVAKRSILGSQILHWGYVNDRESYYKWLWKSDIVISTSRQDFFGISVVQAMQAGCYPLLPNRLAFPEHVPTELHSRLLYESTDDLYRKTKLLLSHWPPMDIDLGPLRTHLSQYNSEILLEQYHQMIKSLHTPVV